MKFSTLNIRNNLKIINGIPSDFVFFDVADGKIYFSSDKIALQIAVEFTDVTDESIFVVSRKDFLHLVDFVDEIEMSSNYHYKSGAVKGKFEKNEAYEESLDAIKKLFSNQESYGDLFVVNNAILTKINRGSIFVNPSDMKPSMKNLDIKNGKIFSSSEFRIYSNDIEEIETDSILSLDVVKSIMSMGEGTVVKNNDESILLSKDDVAIYFSSARDVDYIPLLEESFQAKLNAIYETNELKFNTNEFVSKLEYISFYSSQLPSNLCFLKISDGKATLSTNEETSIDVEIKGINEMEDNSSDFSIPFNAISMLNIIRTLGKEFEEISIYVSKSDSLKMFIIKFGDFERVVLAKINA